MKHGFLFVFLPRVSVAFLLAWSFRIRADKVSGDGYLHEITDDGGSP
jgi:hypothetical protein